MLAEFNLICQIKWFCMDGGTARHEVVERSGDERSRLDHRAEPVTAIDGESFVPGKPRQ
jgi:hypothetical protein